MKVVYIAGAFRAANAWEIQQNVRAAETAGLEVAKLGAMPLIPHKNTEHFSGALPDSFWLEGTAELLKRCDAMYVFNPADLDRSEGTQGEFRLATAKGIPVFRRLSDLAAWLAGGTWLVVAPP